MWRPALHYRWSYRADALLLSRKIVDEILARHAAARALKRAGIRRRQYATLCAQRRRDGATRAHVEGIYLRTLDAARGHPRDASLPARRAADAGRLRFFASMFRHFGLDPTPSRDHAGPRAGGLGMGGAGVERARQPYGASCVRRHTRQNGGRFSTRSARPICRTCCQRRGVEGRRRRFDVAIQGVRYELAHVAVSRLVPGATSQPFRRARRGARRARPRAARAPRLLGAAVAGREPCSGHDPEQRAPFAHGIKTF